MARPWWQVVKPHKDVLSGELTEDRFAADLWSVVQGTAQEEYKDPDLFFRRTFPTQGLVTLLVDVLQRLCRGVGNPIITLQTPFGGGKTHTLIALYHFFQHGRDLGYLDIVREIKERAGIEELPEVRVRVFVGDKVDPLPEKPPYTPLGILMEQLGKYEAIKRHDEEWRSPGAYSLQELLKDKPTVLLLDEITLYCVKLHGKKKDGTELEAQVEAFWQDLTEGIKQLPNCVVIATLPSSAPYGEEAGPAVLDRLQRIFGRMEHTYAPVAGVEVYEIIRRRLFERLGDEDEHREVAQEYWELYQKEGNLVPSVVREVSYRERMVKAYPFHPLLIDLLRERWGTYEQFQRTRGVLRLLAMVVKDLHNKGIAAPLIHPSHIDLREPSLRQVFLKIIGQKYDGVLDADITGDGAHARLVDEELGDEFKPLKVGTGLATTIFLSSFHGARKEEGEEVVGVKKGLERQWLRVSVLYEGTKDAPVDEALNLLKDKSWYLDAEGDLLFFGLEPSLEKVVHDAEETISTEDVDSALKEELNTALRADTFRPFLFPQNSQDIRDSQELKLIVLPPSLPYGAEKTDKFVQDMMKWRGETPRVFKNTVFVVTAEMRDLDQLRYGEDGLKRYLALEKVYEEQREQLSQRKQIELERWKQKVIQELPMKVLRAYKYLAYPTKEGMQWENIGMPSVGEASLSVRVREFLSSDHVGKLVSKLTPERLIRYAFGKDERRKNVSELKGAFAQFTHLPALTSPGVVIEAAREGVKNGKLALKTSEDVVVCREVAEVSDEDEILRWLEIGELTPEALWNLKSYERPVRLQNLKRRLEKLLKDEEPLRYAVREGVKRGIFAVKVGSQSYFREELPEDINWERIVLEEPSVEEPPPSPTITADDILQAMEGAEECSVKDIYSRVWKMKKGDFKDEDEFAIAFYKALATVADREDIEVLVDERQWQGRVIREGSPEVWKHLLERGVVRHRPVGPPPPPPKGLELNLDVPWNKVGKFGQIIAQIVKAQPELEKDISISVTLRTGRSLPEHLEKGLREGLKQLGIKEV